MIKTQNMKAIKLICLVLLTLFFGNKLAVSSNLVPATGIADTRYNGTLTISTTYDPDGDQFLLSDDT